jgi:glycosyltransferase 2 family protein
MGTNRAADHAQPDPPRRARRPSRYSMLRPSIGRHPTDLVRIVVAAGVVLACEIAARSPGINPVEAAIFTEVQQLPAWSAHGWQVLTWLGWWPGIVVAAGLALYLGRVWLATSLALSGALAWVLTLVVRSVAGPRPVPLELLGDVLRSPGPGGFDFPSLHAAVAAALVTTARPYLTRLAQHVTWAAMVLVAAADVFLGHNLPLGVFAGAVLGWGTGTLLHVVLGAPGRRTPESAVYQALAQAGLDGTRITSVSRPLLHPHEYDLVTAEGLRLQMQVVRRLHRSAGPAYQLRRMLVSGTVEHQSKLSTPRHEVEHMAYVALLAERAGIGTIPVLVAGEIAHGPPFLIRRHVEGTRLSQLAPSAVPDAVLDAIWLDVAALGAAHIAHHDLRARNVLVDSAGRPRILDFASSTVGGPAEQTEQDIADMLVSVASVVGVRRAVDSALRALPKDTVGNALPHLQWLSLRRELRQQLDASEVALADLRETLADRIGVPMPSFRSPVRPATLAVMLAGGLAVYLLLPELSSLDDVVGSLAGADPRWLAATVVVGLLSVLASAVSVLGSSPTPLPLWRTLAVQVAATFTGRTTAAGIGFYSVNLVFLERLGFRRSRAVGVIALNRLGMWVVTAVLTVLSLVVIGNAVPVGTTSIPTGRPVLVGVVVALVVTLGFVASSYGRRRVLRPLAASTRELAVDLLPTLRRPLRAAQLIGGSAAFLLISAVGLATTLAAFHQGFAVVPVLAVFIVGSTLGQLVPTPGGLGAVEGALVVGLTAIGIGPVDAVAATLASRLLTFWLPVLPGVVAFRVLQHHDVI